MKWAQILDSADSFDDAQLQALPLTLSAQTDLSVVDDLGELFDERTVCHTSFSRENRNSSIRFRMVFTSRVAMLAFGALIQQFTLCLKNDFIVQLADKHKELTP